MYRSICILVILSLSVLIVSCKKVKNDETYRFAVTSLPEKIDPRLPGVNIHQLITFQLYFPLFEKINSEKYESQYLDMSKTRAIDSSFLKYNFCLKEHLKYVDGSEVRIADLVSTLHRIHSSPSPLGSAELKIISSNCIEIVLDSGNPSYYEGLVGVSSAVVSSNSVSGKVAVGLGAYKVSEFNENRLVAVTSGILNQDIKRFEVYKIESLKNLSIKNINDFNHVYGQQLPKDIESEMVPLKRRSTKTYALLLSISDRSIRQKIAKCFPLLEFKKIVNPSLQDIAGFLPLGILGSDIKEFDVLQKNSSVCRGNQNPKSVDFLNYDTSIREQLIDFFKKYSDRLPISIRYVDVSVNDYVNAVFGKNELMGVVGFDSAGSISSTLGEAENYFEPFLMKYNAKIIDDEILGLEQLVLKARTAVGYEKKNEIYKAAHELVLKSNFIVPMGQYNSTQYYPKWVGNITFYDQTSLIPIVSKMKVLNENR